MEQIQLTEIEELESIYCDMHKDVYGVKARWIKFDTVEQGLYAIQDLQLALEETMRREREEQASAAFRFEERVRTVIETGAKDRETALRWIHQAEGTDGDDEFLCYHCGLPYGYFKKAA